MARLPKEYIEPIKILIPWFLETYCHNDFQKVYLKRALDKIYCSNDVDLTSAELCEVRDCTATATNNISECGVDKELVWSIWKWACNTQA